METIPIEKCCSRSLSKMKFYFILFNNENKINFWQIKICIWKKAYLFLSWAPILISFLRSLIVPYLIDKNAQTSVASNPKDFERLKTSVHLPKIPFSTMLNDKLSYQNFLLFIYKEYILKIFNN